MEDFLSFVFFVVCGALTAFLAYGVPAALLYLAVSGMLISVRQSIVEDS